MKTLSALLLAASFGFVATPSMQASEWDKLTKITVNEPVRLPTMTLQPGNYTLKLLDSPADRHIVLVSDDKGKGMGIILALPNYRLNVTDKTTLQYWETPAGEPRAIRAWFYPGDSFGQEFVYPKTEAVKIEAYTHTTVPTVADTSTDLKTAQVEDFDSANSTPMTASAPAPAPEPEVAAAPAPAPAPEPLLAQAAPLPNPRPSDTENAATPSELPQTATELPLIGTIGGLSLAAFLATRKRRVG